MSLIDYSGIVINQNAAPTGSAAFVGPDLSYYQTFTLPTDYARGENPSIPTLTGFHVYVHIPSGHAANTSIALSLDRCVDGHWVALGSGTKTGAVTDGDVWFTIPLASEVAIPAAWLSSTYRIVITPTHVDSVYFTTPLPLSTGQAFHMDDTPFLSDSAPVAFLFRVLGATADSGIDFLGNVYRSTVVENPPSALASDSGFWMSKPNPSAFAVESLYFNFGSPRVIDALTLDPITPGVSFHVYYSNDEDGPGTDPASWDALLWSPVTKTFLAHRQATYGLPEPICASYLKIEFSRLQARSYDPGPFERPMTYRKHPKWVLDFFLGKFGQEERELIASRIDITYDAHDLGYTYNRDDIIHEPDPPLLSQEATSLDFNQDDGGAHPTTLSRIGLDFHPFQSHPARRGDPNSLLGNAALQLADSSNYPVEIVQEAFGDTTVVSNLRREALLVEKGLTPMHFYLTCRHQYRVVEASFPRHIAYFAGVNHITFHRHLYTIGRDFDQFNEVLGDGQHLAFDFSLPPSLMPAPGT